MRAWIITRDLLFEEDGEAFPSAVGITGPLGCGLTSKEITFHPENKLFQMRDADNIPYYEGFMVGDDLFAPLDDYGGPCSGCTSIWYWNEEKKDWVEL